MGEERKPPALPGEVWRTGEVDGRGAGVCAVVHIPKTGTSAYAWMPARLSWRLLIGNDEARVLSAWALAERARAEQAERERGEARAAGDRLQAAADDVLRWTWSHGDDCPHRHCDNDDCDGSAPEGDCEAPGTPCECGRKDIEALWVAAGGTRRGGG